MTDVTEPSHEAVDADNLLAVLRGRVWCTERMPGVLTLARCMQS